MSSNTLDFHHKQKIQEYNKIIREKLDEMKNCTNNDDKKKILNNIKNIKQEENEYYMKMMDLLRIYYYDEYDEFMPNENENTLEKFLNKKTKIDKIHLLNEYMYRLNNQTKHKKISYSGYQMKECNNCNNNFQTVDITTSNIICENCGNCSFALLNSDKATYIKNPLVETNTFSYRRYDHFVEWLNKFHNTDKSKIPKRILKQIQNELKKNKYGNNINKENIIDILKNTNNSKYMSQSLQIINILKNEKLPKLPKSVQRKMKTMFKQTQEPFAQICPTNRTNFLSYSYVIRKFLEILKQYEYIEYFPLLKSREKLYQQDLIWKDICNQLNWKYNPSI